MEPESYFDIALTRWLPRLPEAARFGRSLEALAGLAEERHHDRWLRDVLAAAPSERLQRGYVALGEAVEANLEDRNEPAMKQARHAATLLRAAGDRAGALRAETEIVYGLQRSRGERDNKECLELGRAVESASASSGYHWILGQVRIDLGTCRAIAGDSSGAYRDHTAALETVRAAGYATLELRADGVRTGVQTNAGILLATAERSRAGLERFWRGAHPANRAQQYYTMLRRAAEQQPDRKHAALAFARASADALVETEHNLAQATNRELAGRLAAEVGFPEEAADQYRRAESLFAKYGKTQASEASRVFVGIYRAEAEAEAGASADALRRLDGLRESVLSSDALRMQVRFHQAAGEAHRKAGDTVAATAAWKLAIELHEELLGSLKSSDNRLASLRLARKAYGGMVTVKWTGGHPARAALDEWEWFRNGEWPGPRKRTPVPLARLDRETFLAFGELPDGIAVWAFDDRGVKGARIAVTPHQLRPVAERFSRLCADPRSDPATLRSVGRQLYQWLVAPVEDRLEPGRTLVIEPDGVVSAVPFAALVDSQSRYLGENFDIVAAAGVWDYLRRKAQPAVDAGSRALIVAGPELTGDASRSFPPLPGASREGSQLSARFSNATVLGGRQATLDAVNRGRPHADLFHFAGHGFAHAGNGGLLLAPAGDGASGSDVLDGKKLAGQNWSRCRLAVLSACSTGTGESGGPVNPESLVRRLLWAGVPRVVASRWRVDSETTLELMDTFYSGLLSGLDTPAALRHAGRRIREREGARHPYYWAGFQAFGSR